MYTELYTSPVKVKTNSNVVHYIHRFETLCNVYKMNVTLLILPQTCMCVAFRIQV